MLKSDLNIVNINPRPNQYFQQIGILIGREGKHSILCRTYNFRGELRTTGPYIGQYPSNYFVNVGIASIYGVDLTQLNH